MRYLLLLFLSAPAMACMNDAGCPIGTKCVKPNGSLSLEGTCVQPTDQWGMPQHDTTQEYEPRKVKECQWDTDCKIGYSCYKKQGELVGMCVK